MSDARDGPIPSCNVATAPKTATVRKTGPDGLPMTPTNRRKSTKIVGTYHEPEHDLATGPTDPPLHRPGRVNTVNTNADAERLARLLDQDSRETTTQRADPPVRHTPNRT